MAKISLTHKSLLHILPPQKSNALSISARRLVSEAKKFATDSAWDICNLAMQIVGGIGYTNVYPLERMIRDTRLIQIWTGTNDIMNLLIQHENCREVLKDPNPGRMIEGDAEEAGQDEEKVMRMTRCGQRAGKEKRGRPAAFTHS
jgi:hypothetical protein